MEETGNGWRHRELAYAAAMGLVSGGRSGWGPAVLSWGWPRDRRGAVDRVMSGRASRYLSAGMALGELALDKLPQLPDRTRPDILVGRTVSGALGGAGYARVRGGPVLPSALLGATGAVAAAYGLNRARRSLTQRTPLPGAAVALAEDAVVAGLASLVYRAMTRPAMQPAGAA